MVKYLAVVAEPVSGRAGLKARRSGSVISSVNCRLATVRISRETPAGVMDRKSIPGLQKPSLGLSRYEV